MTKNLKDVRIEDYYFEEIEEGKVKLSHMIVEGIFCIDYKESIFEARGIHPRYVTMEDCMDAISRHEEEFHSND